MTNEQNMVREWMNTQWSLPTPGGVTTPGLYIYANPVQQNARAGQPLLIHGVAYTHGLYCHAVSRVRVKLPSPGARFSAVLGVDDHAQGGSVVYTVSIGDQEIYRSALIHGGEAGVPIDIDLHDAQEFTLSVGDGGDGIASDQANWADACVTLQNNKTVMLGDMPITEYSALPGCPFAFTYDGMPSGALLPTWDCQDSSQVLDATRTEHTRIFTDPKTGLVVRCVLVEYQDFPAVDWVVYFTNPGTTATPILENIQAWKAIWPAQDPRGILVSHQLGDDNSANSFKPIDDRFTPDTPRLLDLCPTAGRPSEGNMPFFNLVEPDGGIATAIGWTGQWDAQFEQTADKTFRIRAGQQTTHLKLLPGETIRTPRMLLVFWHGDDPQRGTNQFRQVLMAHYLPRRQGALVIPPIAGTTNVVDPDGTYEGPHVRAMQPYAKLGVETFWSDMDPQQWYPLGFPNGTGTWEPDLTKYPHGLKPIGDAAHAAGLQYLLWFEPERVHVGTKIDTEHPEWVMRAQGEQDSLFRIQDPLARKWLTDYIDVQITQANLDWLRWDFNIQPLGFWQREDAPDRKGSTENHYVQGLLAMWDDLRARHPGMVIDLVSSGGRRLELESLMRGVPLWHSDLQCDGPHPVADQLQNGALYRWIPFHSTASYGLEPSLNFRSNLSTGNVLGGMDILDPKLEPAVKRTVALYQKIRPYFTGDFYPLFPHAAGEDTWYGYQFHRTDLHAGFAIVYRRAQCPDAAQPVALRGIEATARYEVTDEDTGKTEVLTGTALQQFTVTVPEKPGSALVFYRKL